jgi:hypothetical protein
MELSYGKSKTIPVQIWTGPESSKGLRVRDLKKNGT